MRHLLSLLWHLFVGWSGLAFGIAATLFYGPKKLIETWDWYLDRFYDSSVFGIVKTPKLQSAVRQPSFSPRSPLEVEHTLSAYHASEIAKRLQRNEKRVARSLERLERRGKIKGDPFGWYPKL